MTRLYDNSVLATLAGVWLMMSLTVACIAVVLGRLTTVHDDTVATENATDGARC